MPQDAIVDLLYRQGRLSDIVLPIQLPKLRLPSITTRKQSSKYPSRYKVSLMDLCRLSLIDATGHLEHHILLAEVIEEVVIVLESWTAETIR